jgi:glycosidase
MLRHTNPALIEGKYVPLDESNDKVLSYLRSYQGHEVLVVLNMSAEPEMVHVPVKSARMLAASPADAKWNRDGELLVAPFGVYIGEVRGQPLLKGF